MIPQISFRWQGHDEDLKGRRAHRDTKDVALPNQPRQESWKDLPESSRRLVGAVMGNTPPRSLRNREASREINALDFDDLLIKAVGLCSISRSRCREIQPAVAYVMVDEYQDTNRQQYRLVRHLTSRARNICVVGRRDHPSTAGAERTSRTSSRSRRTTRKFVTIRLEQNYRSTKNILAAASAVVANNRARKGKTLWTQNPQAN
jgi:superfamily I DNA/RNA helicase